MSEKCVICRHHNAEHKLKLVGTSGPIETVICTKCLNFCASIFSERDPEAQRLLLVFLESLLERRLGLKLY